MTSDTSDATMDDTSDRASDAEHDAEHDAANDAANDAVIDEVMGASSHCGFGTVRFEACAHFASPSLDGPCERCGWLEADHAPEADLAVVVEVTPRPIAPLRRAS